MSSLTVDDGRSGKVTVQKSMWVGDIVVTSLENVSHHTWYLQKLIFPDLLLGTLCQIPK